MQNEPRGWRRIDPFHEMLEQERKRLAFRPSKLQRIVFKDGLKIEKEIVEARRFDTAIL